MRKILFTAFYLFCIAAGSTCEQILYIRITLSCVHCPKESWESSQICKRVTKNCGIIQMFIILPKTLLVSILSEWTVVVDLVRLDSAICGENQRAIFLQTVCDSMFVLCQQNKNIVQSYTFICWVQKRGISLGSLKLPIQINSIAKDYLVSKGLRVRYVDLNFYAGIVSNIAVFDEKFEAVIHNCGNLEALHNISTECITIDRMVMLRQACPKLHSLTFVGGRMNVQANLALYSLLSGGLTFLERLCLHPDGGNIVSDATLTIIAQSCPRLHTFELSDSNSVTCEGLAAIAASCTKLAVLHLSACRNIADNGIISVAMNCQFMERLNVEGNWKITDAAVNALIKWCKHLVYLCIDREQVSSRATKLLTQLQGFELVLRQ